MSPIRSIALAAALAASLGAPLAASAQQAPAPAAPPAAAQPARHHGAHFMHALRTLNLTDAQKAQIKTAFQQTRTANTNADPSTRKANMQQLRSQIDGILTADQRAQLQAEIQKERAAGMNAPGSGTAPHA